MGGLQKSKAKPACLGVQSKLAALVILNFDSQIIFLKILENSRMLQDLSYPVSSWNDIRWA